MSVSLRVRWQLSLCCWPARPRFAAEEFLTPPVSVARVEWRAVLDQLRAEIGAAPAVASDFTFSVQRRVAASDPRSMPALVQLNAVTSPIFAGIGRSPVPVLLPFDAAAYLEARQNGAPAASARALSGGFPSRRCLRRRAGRL